LYKQQKSFFQCNIDESAMCLCSAQTLFSINQNPIDFGMMEPEALKC